MKDAILNRLNNHAEMLVKKEELSQEEVNFLVFWMQRIEFKESEEINKALREENNAQWKQSMMSMIDTLTVGRE